MKREYKAKREAEHVSAFRYQFVSIVADNLNLVRCTHHPSIYKLRLRSCYGSKRGCGKWEVQRCIPIIWQESGENCGSETRS